MAEISEVTPLTEEQLRFCHEYAADPHSATRAYMRAFKQSSCACARVQACRLLAQPNIKLEIVAARISHQRSCSITSIKALRGLVAVAFADPIDMFDDDPDGMPVPKPLSRVPPHVRQTFQSMKVKRRRLRSDKDKTQWEVEEVEYKFADKMSAFDKLCKHLGITKDGAAFQELIDALRGGPAAKETPDAKAVEGSAGSESDPKPLIASDGRKLAPDE